VASIVSLLALKNGRLGQTLPVLSLMRDSVESFGHIRCPSRRIRASFKFTLTEAASTKSVPSWVAILCCKETGRVVFSLRIIDGRPRRASTAFPGSVLVHLEVNFDAISQIIDLSASQPCLKEG